MSIKALVDFALFFIGVVVAGTFYIEFRRTLGANLDFWSDQEMWNRRSFLSRYSPYQQMRSEYQIIVQQMQSWEASHTAA